MAVNVCLTMPEEMRKVLDEYAQEKETTVSGVIRLLLKEKFRQEGLMK